MIPVYLLLAESVLEEEREMILRAARKLPAVFPGCEVRVAGHRSQVRYAVPDVEAVLEKVPAEDGKRDASLLMRLLVADTRRLDPAGIWLLFLGDDLRLSSLRLSWCFGAASTGKRVSVQSFARFRGLTEEERFFCLRRTLRHEIGHMCGMAADRNRAGVVEDHGPHCSRPGCSMRQTGTLEKLLAARAQEEGREDCFCPDCRADYRRFVKKTEEMQKKGTE